MISLWVCICFYLKNIISMCRNKAQVDDSLVFDSCRVISFDPWYVSLCMMPFFNHCCSRLIYCLVLIIIVWEYLRQSPRPFRPTKIRPSWWTRSLSQHWSRACNQCPCLMVWEEAHLPLPSSYGPGLLDDSRWLLLYSNHWYSSLTPDILISNICGCRACF